MPLPPFPVTPILDDFNRADETPLTGGGNWPRALGNTIFTLSLVGNQVVSQATQNTRASRLWTGPQNRSYGTPQEVYVTIGGSVSTGRVGIYNRVTEGGVPGDVEGFLLEADFDTDLLVFRSFVGVSFFDLYSEARTWSVGDKIGIRSLGHEHYLYVDQGAGWALTTTVFNNTHYGDIYNFGVALATQTPRLDNFGGGNYKFGQVMRLQMP